MQTVNWIYLALLAPAIWAIITLIDENLIRHIYKGAHVGAIISGFFGLIPAIIIFFGYTKPFDISGSLIFLSIFAGFINVFYYFLYFKALQKAHPSVVIAMFSISPAIIPFIAYFLVGERLSTEQIVGFGIVVIAGFLYSLTDVRRFRISKALIPTLLAAAIFDAVSLINKYVYTKADFYQSYMYFSLGMFLAALYLLYVLLFMNTKVQVRNVIRKNSVLVLLLLAGAEVLNIFAELVRNLALDSGPVSIVKALENLQPLYMLIISVVFFPFLPKFFPEAQAKYMSTKILLSIVIILGVFIAI